MAFIITIAQRKGGAGKTTLACQLAAACGARGRVVAGFDLDPQGSFSLWRARRAVAGRDMAFADVRRSARFPLSTLLFGASEDSDVIVIDTPPEISDIVRDAIAVADLVVTPLQLSAFDLDATLPTAEMIGAAGVRALFVVNRAPQRARIADAIRNEIRRQGLPLARTELGDRVSFAESIAQGLGVVELAPRSTAAAEIGALGDEVMSLAGARAAAE